MKLKPFKSLVRQFEKDQRGAVLILVTLFMIPLLATVAVAVDFGRTILVKKKLADAIDAAALAVAVQPNITQAKANAKASAYIKAHYPDLDIGSYKDIKVSLGETTVGITATGSLATTFLKIAGYSTLDVAVKTEVVRLQNKLEVVMVLDNTGSMCEPCSKLKSLKTSATDLVNTVMTDQSGEMVKIGLVPFAEMVNIGTGNRSEQGLDIPQDYMVGGKYYKWYGCMASRGNGLNLVDEDYHVGVPGDMAKNDNKCQHKAIMRLTTNKDDITKNIDEMTALNGTYIPSGLMWGWRLLSDQAPFPDGASFDDESVHKAIVLMTDGANTMWREKVNDDRTVNHANEIWLHTGWLGNHYSPPDTNDDTEDLCENIKAQGIILHTIAFDVEDGSAIETLMRDCAGNGGNFYDADDSSELAAAFEAISKSLLNLRFSK
jgi:Flp pilus assembly protein TadG